VLCCRLFAKVSDQVWQRKTFLIFYHLLDNYTRCAQQQQQQQQQQLTLAPGARQVEAPEPQGTQMQQQLHKQNCSCGTPE
jgi:hypothetical protein